MQKYSTIKYCSLVFCVFLVFTEMTSSVPFYSEDENDLAGSDKEKDYQIRNKSIDLNRLDYRLSKKRNKQQTKLIADYALRKERFRASLPISVSSVSPAVKGKSENEDIRDLYELLLKKKALADQLIQTHQITRKSNRSPSLRLRFGKKRDPYYANSPMGHPVHILEDSDNF